METTFTFLKQSAPSAAVLAVLFFIWTEMSGLRSEMSGLRSEMSRGFQEVRTEMAADHQAIRAEMAEEFKAVRSDISDLRERTARVETRLGSIEDRLYVDTARPPM